MQCGAFQRRNIHGIVFIVDINLLASVWLHRVRSEKKEFLYDCSNNLQGLCLLNFGLFCRTSISCQQE